MSWEWPNTDKLGLARHTLAESAKLIELPISRYDQPQNQKGRRQVIDAIYSTLQEKGVRYALEKYNAADPTQLIRTPSEIVGQKEGTCLDLALLFCGVCLGYELLPLIILIEGHALAAVSLNYDLRTKDALNRSERRYFQDALLTDVDALRQMVDGGAYLPVECTGFAQTQNLPESLPEGVNRNFKGLLSFERAIAAGREQLNGEDRPFLFALDIAAAQDSGFTPTTEVVAQKPEAANRSNVTIGEGIEIEDADELEVTGRRGGAPSAGDTNLLNKGKLKGVKKISLVGEEITIPKDEKK